MGWLEFDIGGVADGMPNDFAAIGVLEPTAVRIVAPQVGVEGSGHGTDVAMTGHGTGGGDLPRVVQARGCSLVITSKMLALHIADWYGTDRRLPGVFYRLSGRMPGNDRPGAQRPFVDRADRNFADTQYCLPPVLDGCSSATLAARSRYPLPRSPLPTCADTPGSDRGSGGR